MIAPHVPALAILALSLAAPAAAQAGRTVLRDGDPILGNGLFERVDDLKVNNHGSWIAEVFADYAPLADNAVLRNGFVAIRESSPVLDPAGSQIKQFDAVDFNDRGQLLMIVAFTGPGIAPGDDSAVMINSTLVFREDGPIVHPSFGAGTVWETFQMVKFNSRNQFLLVGEVRDPTIDGTKEDVLILVEVDDQGNMVEMELMAIEAQVFPEFKTREVRDIHNLPHGIGLNELGDVIWSFFLDGAVTSDAVVMLNSTKLAQEGDPAPVFGRTWRDLGNKPLDLNGRREFIFRGSLDTSSETPELAATDDVIVIGRVEDDGSVTMEKLAQEGDVLPALAPFALAEPGNNAVIPNYRANNGASYWIAITDNPIILESEAIMRNDQIVLQRGVSMVEGALVQTIRSATNGFHVSRDGRFLVAEINLQNQGESVVYFDFGTIVEIDQCNPTGGRFTSRDGKALPGDTLTFDMDGGQGAGVQTALFISPRRVGSASGCGAELGFGEILINQPIVHSLFGPDWNGTDPTALSITLPVDLTLVDTIWYMQGLFIDVGNQLPAEDFRLTNGLRLEIGTP